MDNDDKNTPVLDSTEDAPCDTFEISTVASENVPVTSSTDGSDVTRRGDDISPIHSEDHGNSAAGKCTISTGMETETVKPLPTDSSESQTQPSQPNRLSDDMSDDTNKPDRPKRLTPLPARYEDYETSSSGE